MAWLYEAPRCDCAVDETCDTCNPSTPAPYPCDECDDAFTESRDPDGLLCTDCYGRYMVEFNRA